LPIFLLNLLQKQKLINPAGAKEKIPDSKQKGG
jgi:hypothetical protein